jgi:hypothetical protein
VYCDDTIACTRVVMRESCSWGESPSAVVSSMSPRELLLQARHADHEELVEVRRDDGEELHPLQQRHRGVGRLVEHALVELKPREPPG